MLEKAGLPPDCGDRDPLSSTVARCPVHVPALMCGIQIALLVRFKSEQSYNFRHLSYCQKINIAHDRKRCVITSHLQYGVAKE